MPSGVIKQVKADRGFGFIHRPSERDVFFHRDDWQGPMDFDEQLVELAVTFDLDDGGVKGPRARNVKPQ